MPGVMLLSSGTRCRAGASIGFVQIKKDLRRVQERPISLLVASRAFSCAYGALEGRPFGLVSFHPRASTREPPPRARGPLPRG